uniref:Toll/interleukin-1 receptor-like protein n=1 Tax=Tanacetum cinerariifolium TaxID=118510 RepID=A0A6L2L6A4_TANCI|nr:Toll/interleukin-1 receptor-like protein [Tanacetum cinerariifolium]
MTRPHSFRLLKDKDKDKDRSVKDLKAFGTMKESTSSPAFCNAFELISSMSYGFDLSTLFEINEKKNVASIFTSKFSAANIVERIERAARELSTLDSPRISYDVFLSFRGEDTRYSFTDHLYDALKRAGIDHTFKDNEEINKGGELKPEIERAIKESRASIVVLSENYATSAWCLDELSLILEQRWECNRFVLPIFYHVNPSDIRKRSEIPMIEVDAYPRWAYYKMTHWKNALKEVADLAGMVISGHDS